MTVRPRKTRRLALIGLWLGAGLVAGCAKDSHSAPGGSLTELPEGLRWSLTVGLLNDRDLPELGAQDFRRIVGVAQSLAGGLPGLQPRLIPDQPMDAHFLMGRTYVPRKLRRPHESGALLDLGGGPQNARRLAQSGAPSALLARLEQLRSRLGPTGQPLVYDKAPASHAAWKTYLGAQVRYDLVLTNAIVFPDDLRDQGQELLPEGGLRAQLLPAHGRRGVEYWGGFLSLRGRLPTASDGDRGVSLAASELAVLVLRLLAVMDNQQAALVVENQRSGRAVFSGCSGCAGLWQKRLLYLRALFLHQHRRFEESCALLARADYLNELSGRIDLMRRNALAKQRHQLLTACQKP